MNAIQVLTDDSVFEIKRAIRSLEVFNEDLQLEKIEDNIAKLKQIIEDVK